MFMELIVFCHASEAYFVPKKLADKLREADKAYENGDVDAIRLQVVELIRTGTVPQPVARDIMVSPVRTVKPDITMELWESPFLEK